MNVLNKKLSKKSGFTLVEMLIVVAIIAILIAISIPLVNSALERSRDATDKANERSAKAEALIIYLDAGQTSGNATIYGLLMGDGACYNATTGKLDEDDSKVTAYGQCANISDKGFAGTKNTTVQKTASDPTTNTGDHRGQVLWVYCNGDGDVVLTWITKS